MTLLLIMTIVALGSEPVEEPRVAIYLTSPEEDCRTPTTHVDGIWKTAFAINEVSLAEEPWLTDEVVERFDPATNTFTVSDDTTISFPQVSVFGTGFVVVVDDERVSGGMFWTPYSSLCCCPLLGIDIDPDVTRKEYVQGIARVFQIRGMDDNKALADAFSDLGKSSD